MSKFLESAAAAKPVEATAMGNFEQVCADIAKYRNMAKVYESWALDGLSNAGSKARNSLNAYSALRQLGLTMIENGRDDAESLALYKEACGQ